MPTTPVAGHNPRPATFNPDKCAICGVRIMRVATLVGESRVPTKRYVHVKDTTEFDGTRQKTLYERLDVIADSLRDVGITLPELVEVLRTLHSWRDHAQLWRTVRRWTKDHNDEL